MLLDGKVALITGGGTGIGRSIAKAYASEGATVLILGRRKDKLREAVQAIRKELSNNPNLHYYPCDLCDWDQVDRVAEGIKEDHERLDVLVNNAGILGKRKTILDYPRALWKEVMDINFNGLFYITQALLPLMIAQKGGSIINVSSSVGRAGRKEWGAYSASKFAVESFTQTLFQELESYNIRVNSVNPGATRTDMRAEAYPDENPLRLPHPDKIVGLFLYLANNQSSGVTGQSLSVQNWKNPMG
ncbi:MAG: NAD(P)-dependent oxidoreductase [bacterium]|nr:MAG: NAD(P)-dependent oxidoreductase [bacterium]